jgi:hypothetical protein
MREQFNIWPIFAPVWATGGMRSGEAMGNIGEMILHGDVNAEWLKRFCYAGATLSFVARASWRAAVDSRVDVRLISDANYWGFRVYSFPNECV